MKVLGINSERDCCECCGKQNLKKVVWLQNDNGVVMHYGSNCAARATGKNSNWIDSNLLENFQTVHQTWYKSEEFKEFKEVLEGFRFMMKASNNLPLEKGTEVRINNRKFYEPLIEEKFKVAVARRKQMFLEAGLKGNPPVRILADWWDY